MLWRAVRRLHPGDEAVPPGEIEGEYDLPDDTLTCVDDRTLLVAGSMTIGDFNEAVGTQLPQDVVRTMAGLVFSALGRRPQPGDTVTLDSTRLTVEQMDGMRITAYELSSQRVPGQIEGARYRRPVTLLAG